MGGASGRSVELHVPSTLSFALNSLMCLEGGDVSVMWV